MVRLGDLLKNWRDNPASSGHRGTALEEASSMILDSLGQAALTTDASGKVQYINADAEHLTGWSHSEALGRSVSEVIQLVHSVTRAPLQNPVEAALIESRTAHIPKDASLIQRGRHLAIEGSAGPIFDRDGHMTGVAVVLQDISAFRQLTNKLAHQANHDALTGLVNRRVLERRLEGALVSARGRKIPHVLCYMDLDQFKVVNDSCGHAAGDELLLQVVKLLRGHIRQRDTLARLGGDEFGLLLESCPLDQAEGIARDILESIRNFRFSWEGKNFSVGISIGVTAITPDSKDIATILSVSDTACYVAKEKGRNRIQVYGANDLELADRQREMRKVARIREALDENRFTLFFQPIAPLSKTLRRGGHIEILLRMLGPENQLVPPSEFIPAAERYNLMPALDRWVIENAFAAYKKIHRERGEEAPNTWAINLSGTSLDSDGLIEFIRAKSALHGVPPKAICFEITETAAVANIDKAMNFIWGLRTDGFKFALDDFGKGMSSFSYLKSLPLDFVKIDGDFVKNVLQDKVSIGIVQAINHVAQVMQLQTIAEYVASPELLHKVTALGINYAQGYAVGKPLSLDFPTKMKALPGDRSGRIEHGTVSSIDEFRATTRGNLVARARYGNSSSPNSTTLL
ncbi:MAG TPA: EAL domain-containing protein [Pyrinomonadaceae bacterium]|nr:EAL domain-containing protein [Pyrinomonadaceae bacterium]